MNFCEKLLRSAYGRPFYKMITGVEIQRKLWADIHEVLVIDKGIVEASCKDIEHTFCCYEYLQKEIHPLEGNNISRFTQVLSSPAQKLVSEEAMPFARSFSQVVIRVINAICESGMMVFSVAQIKQISLRPSTQFFQNFGNISKTVLDFRVRQSAFVAA